MGAWRLGERLGSGGIAAVFRATHEDGRPAAVKVLHPASLGTDEVKRFQREYRALARLRHDNIVRVYETGVQDGYPWIAMELVDGQDLDTRINRWEIAAPADRWEQVERVLRGLCEALAHVHEQGLVHRDLKPGNVLVDQRGQAKLSDFGVVKDRQAQTTALTMHGNLVGTVAFMAPEQITGEEVDARTDLYSLGAVLYVMLTGRRPIEATSVTGFLARHLSHVPPAPSTVRPSVPRRLEAICQRLLYKDRAQRFPSARSVLRALDDEAGPDAIAIRGRDRLLAAWRDRLEALGGGEGGTVLVAGPEGSGRCFVLDAFEGLAEGVGARVSRASGQGRNPVSTLLGGLGGDVDTPVSGHLRALAEAARGHPTVLLIDSLDEASPTMRTALARLVDKVALEEGSPLLLAGTVGESADDLQVFEDTGAVTWPLGPVPRRAVAAMLRDRGLRGPALAALARRLHSELRGRPGAVDAQVRALLAEGWLTEGEGRLEPQVPPRHLAHEPLPVPGRARTDVERRRSRLDPEALGQVEALAVLGRPTTASVVAEIALADRPLTPEASADLVEEVSIDGQVHLHLGWPWAAAVIREGLSAERLAALHGSAARVLDRTHRRSLAREVAEHFDAAGEPAEAYPRYVRAARKAAQARQHADVLRLCGRARVTRPAGEARLPPSKRWALRRRLYQLEGEAHLARGAWRAALDPLREAVEAAQETGGGAALTRALGARGRALYRLGRFDEATPVLEAALAASPPGTPERTSAVRALADLRLRSGRLDDATALWDEALEVARQAGSPDGEARARRGLAHLHTLRGDLGRAVGELERALDLLHADSAPRVRASLLARGTELDLAAGRFASALHRAESLVELATHRELDDRLAGAWLLLAEARHFGGQPEAAEAVRRASALLDADEVAPLDRLATARMWLLLGDAEAAAAALPEASDPLPDDPVEAFSTRCTALRARLLAPRRPDRASDLARWCLVRPPPRLVLRHAEVMLDAGYALLAAGDPGGARSAAKAGLKPLSGAGLDGLRLALLELFHAADPDPRVRDALVQVLRRLLRDLPPPLAAAVAARPGRAALLGNDTAG